MNFSENLKFLRTRRNKSQTDLAAELGLTRTSLSGYERKCAATFPYAHKNFGVFQCFTRCLDKIQTRSAFRISAFANR